MKKILIIALFALTTSIFAMQQPHYTYSNIKIGQNQVSAIRSDGAYVRVNVVRDPRGNRYFGSIILPPRETPEVIMDEEEQPIAPTRSIIPIRTSEQAKSLYDQLTRTMETE